MGLSKKRGGWDPKKETRKERRRGAKELFLKRAFIEPLPKPLRAVVNRSQKKVQEACWK